MTKQQQLVKLEAEITQNNVCLELAEQATQLVFGDGNPDADIVFIGEAPGKNEDLQGKPFVGAAGKFLDEMLQSISLNRQDIYITNIVKYRPPNNRDPLPEEKRAFWPYLVRQLDVIQPKLVVTLGRHSMEYFLPNLKISAVHGQPKRIKLSLNSNQRGDKNPEEQALMSLVILPLFHPAAALYNGGLRQTLVDDFSNIPTTLNKLTKN